MRHVTVTYSWLFLLFLLQVTEYQSRTLGTLSESPIYGLRNLESVHTMKLQERHATLGTVVHRKLYLKQDQSCDCNDYCLAPNSSELEILTWIENHPIFCKESSRMDIDKKAYMAFCFFDCCRKCNIDYFNCSGLEQSRAHCLNKAYECAGHCVKESSMNITIKGW